MKYTIERNWSGYSRGISLVRVEADSIEEARDKFEVCDWDEIVWSETIRDDTESELDFSTLKEEK